MSLIVKGILTVAVIALLAIWGIAAYCSYTYVHQVVSDPIFARVLSGFSLGADVLKAVSLIAAGVAYTAGNKKKAIGCAIIWLGTTCWSGVSCYGFFSTVASNGAASKALVNSADASLVTQLNEQVAEISRLQAYKRTQRQSSWDKIDEQIAKVEARTDSLREQLKSIKTTQGAPDAFAKNLEAFGISPELAASVRALVFMLLLEVISNGGIWAFSILLGIDYEAFIRRSFAPTLPTPPPAPQPPTHRPIPMSEPRRQARQPRQANGSDYRIQSQVLLGELKSRFQAGVWVPKDDVFGTYRQLATESGWKLHPFNKIGQQLKNLGIEKKDEGGNRIHYRWVPTQPKDGGGARLSVIGGGLSKDSRA